MAEPIVGLHHVTAIAADPQRNLDFYTGILGLRFVKQTVNFDDPGSYHFYFGDDTGSPGTILTFFSWPQVGRGTAGVGETQATAFSAPASSISFWRDHLSANGIAAESPALRFGAPVLSFSDPDGMRVEIVGNVSQAAGTPARDTAIPDAHAIRGFDGVTLAVAAEAPTARVLETMGFAQSGEQDGRVRFSSDAEAPGSHIDLIVAPRMTSGRMGAGTVHHIAFRVPDDAAQLEWRTKLEREGLRVTTVQDRTYFRSIYFREPGGVLFEIATDAPGFAIDEPIEALGETLKLPEWLEPKRIRIEQALPPIELNKTQLKA